MQTGERTIGIAGPGRGQGAGEVVLLGDEIEGAVAHPSRLDEQQLRRGGQDVGQQPSAAGLPVVDEPGQPALHAVEVDALGEPLPLLATPRFAGHELGGALAHVGGRHQFASREDAHLVDVADRTLVVDAERGQPVDLVTPQVDADRRVGRGGVDVDDRAATGELAPVLDEFLAAIAELHERRRELVGIDLGPGPNDDRVDRGRVRAELLEQRPHAGDDHGGDPLGVAEAPQHLESLTHGLDARADPLERQRLPAGELDDLVGGQELAQVVGQLPGHRAGRAGDDQRAAGRQPGERGDRDRSCHLDDGEAGARVTEGPGEARLVTQELGERAERGADLLARHGWHVIACH